MSLLLGSGALLSANASTQPACLLLLRQLSSLGASASHTPAAPAAADVQRSSSGSASRSSSPVTLAQSLYHQLRTRGSLVAPGFVETAITKGTQTSRQAQHVLAARDTTLPLRNYLENATFLQAAAQNNKYPQHRVLGDKHRLVMEHIADSLHGDGDGQPPLGLERHLVWLGVASQFRNKMQFRGVLQDLRGAGLLTTYPPTKKNGCYMYGPTQPLGQLWLRLRLEALRMAGSAPARAQELPPPPPLSPPPPQQQ